MDNSSIPINQNSQNEQAPVGLTGSQMQETKPRLPIGVFIVAFINLIGFVVGFFDSSQNSAILTIIMLLNLLLAIGLLMRLEIARAIMFWLEAVTLLISIVCFVLLFNLQHKMNNVRNDYNAAMSKIDQSQLTTVQKQQLDDLKSSISDLEKQAGKAVEFTYIKLGATTLFSAGIMVYLSRPKIKESFRKLNN
jgi:hypothetical protein